VRRRLRHSSHKKMMPAIGARFGRMRMATAAATPAENAAVGVCPSAQATDTAHAAAAGTSLIGAISMNRTVGLAATSHAAATPTIGLPSWRPIA